MSCSKIAAAAAVEEDVVPLFQQDLPQHFLLKVESFSLLTNDKYESDEFEVDGYKWRLILYPNGDKKRNVDNHISLYLSLSGRNNLPQSWEVKAQNTLFVYNFLSDKYLTFQVANTSIGLARRFYCSKTEWGFSKLLDLDYFKEISNGYLFEDTCVFGAEVSVIRMPKIQCLSMIKETDNNIFSWKIHNFSAIKEECIHSERFKIENVHWKLKLYPKGVGSSKGTDISLFLLVAEDDSVTSTADWKIYADYILRIRNQINSNRLERQTSHWFTKLELIWGFPNLLPLSLVNCEKLNFLVNDTLIVEAEFSNAGAAKDSK